MAIASPPPAGSSHRSPATSDAVAGGLEAPGVRPSALIAALAAGGTAWYVVLTVLSWLV